MSASGHIPSGQTPIESLLRETEEELGINISKDDIFLLGKFWRNEKHRDDFIENELDYIYVLLKDFDLKEIKIQEEEVERVDWISIADFKEMLKDRKAVQRKGVWNALFEYVKKLELGTK